MQAYKAYKKFFKEIRVLVLTFGLPEASRDPETLAAISANLSANLLGLGNAATPLGIRAARRMAQGYGVA